MKKPHLINNKLSFIELPPLYRLFKYPKKWNGHLGEVNEKYLRAQKRVRWRKGGKRKRAHETYRPGRGMPMKWNIALFIPVRHQSFCIYIFLQFE